MQYFDQSESAFHKLPGMPAEQAGAGIIFYWENKNKTAKAALNEGHGRGRETGN